ncbi:GGDEF domain-containing protein [uncultured Salinisphaera sp.]|uniref:GGDEF domain-containing protein n=1 Tax=uncultured Salinisphaera sp. TaxID=359372 RepID=UPI0032B2596E
MTEEATRLERALAADGLLKAVAIAPGLVAEYERYVEPQKRRILVAAVMLGIFNYTAFALLDWWVLTDIIGLVWFMRLCVCLPIGCLGLYLVSRPNIPLVWQQLLSCVLCWGGIAILSGLILLSDRPESQGYLLGNYALIFFALTLMALPVRMALGLTVATFALLAATVLLGPGIAPAFKMPYLATGVVLLIPAVYANWSTENERRRHFLLVTRERIRQRQLSEQRDILDRLAAIDPLTGLSNRRGLDIALAKDIEQAGSEAWVVLAMLDIDSFKPYNDNYGHPAGDEALKLVAKALDYALDGRTRLARIGGEEFVAVRVARESTDIAPFAEQFRAAVERLALPHGYSVTTDVVTVSVGASAGVLDEDGSLKTLFTIADRALYEAKTQGRNRVVVFEPLAACARQQTNTEAV